MRLIRSTAILLAVNVVLARHIPAQAPPYTVSNGRILSAMQPTIKLDVVVGPRVRFR